MESKCKNLNKYNKDKLKVTLKMQKLEGVVWENKWKMEVGFTFKKMFKMLIIKM